MMIRLTYGALISAVLSSGLLAQDSGFEARRNRLLTVAADEQEVSFFGATARLLTGGDRESAFAMLDSLSHDRSMGGMFYCYTLIGTYLHVQHLLPDTLKKKIRDAYQFRTMYRGDTENHWVMYYTGLYLAAQTWPDDPGERWFNGRSSQENFREAEGWLNHWMHITSTIGQGEFDSPTYSTVFLTPMMVLHQFARDSLMKRKAGMMLDLLFVDFAAEHLAGNYGGGHSRDYPDDIINPLAAPSTMWAWLYFGFPEFEPWNAIRFKPRNRGGWETVMGAVSSYRLPEVIFRIATDRDTPYVHTETKRVRNIIRFSDVMNPPVYKYTAMTADYVMGSLQGGILQPIQQHTWDVTYRTDKPNNTVFTLHPFYSGRELAMFFPEEIKFLAEEVDRYHLVYTSPDKWNSSSPYERIFQHNNTLIALYNIAPHAHHQHIDGFFPKTLDERIVDPSGWIFCRGGNTFIAFLPLRKYEWIEEEMDWRFRSHVLKNGVVVEVGRLAEDKSFSAFCDAVRTKTDMRDELDSAMTVTYHNRVGDILRFTFDGPRLVNGKAVDFASYGLFGGPYVQSERGSGRITIRYRNIVRNLDFNRGIVTQEGETK